MSTQTGVLPELLTDNSGVQHRIDLCTASSSQTRVQPLFTLARLSVGQLHDYRGGQTSSPMQKWCDGLQDPTTAGVGGPLVQRDIVDIRKRIRIARQV